MPTSVKDMLSSANASVPKITTGEARRLIDDEGALLIDVRDAPELEQTGKLKSAVNVSRGWLEFRADPIPQRGVPAGPSSYTLLRFWRPFGSFRQGYARHGLRSGLQLGRL